MRSAAAAILVVLAACSSSTATTTTTAVDVPDRLAVLDAQGTLRAMDPDGSNDETIVDGSDRLVLQPTWSPAGERLAWVEVVLAGGPDNVAVVTAASDGSDRSRTPVSSPPFYLAWASDGDKLVVLHNGVVELEAGLIDLAVDEPAEEVLARGQPFYFAWAPDGSMLLANVGVSDRLGFIDLDGTEDALGPEPGLFQAPAWVGDVLFFVKTTDGDQQLVGRPTDGGDDVVYAEPGGFIHFVVSPDGSRLAFRELDLSAPAVTVSMGAQGTPTVGDLVVVELETGERTTVASGNPFGFWWSPDSQQLLYLSVEDGGFRWRVWDGATVNEYETFLPSRTFGRDYLPFFDQFAQSVEFWAPDSSAFVYAGRIEDGSPSQVWLQPLDGPVRPIADGVFATFPRAP